MAAFSWLHLTDLHKGMRGDTHLWPNIRQAFYKDLADQYKRRGAWDVVLFTGDLVQKGSAEEFTKLNDEILKPLWEYFQELGFNPALLAVPGNHDLQRPQPLSAAARMLTKWGNDPEIQEEFWETPDSEYRQVVDRAFQNYSAWWNEYSFRGSLDIQSGRLPGDFSTIVSKDGFQIGIVGLNVTFLQLTGGDYTGKLVWGSLSGMSGNFTMLVEGMERRGLKNWIPACCLHIREKTG
jgi:hypothetical protein